MAKYLVIEFDNDDQADKMVAKIEGVGSDTYRIAGIFKKPLNYCACPPREAYVRNDFVRGGKFGWWVHRICKKPRRGTHNLVNLLKPHDRRWSGPLGYDAAVSEISIFELPVQNIKQPELKEA